MIINILGINKLNKKIDLFFVSIILLAGLKLTYNIESLVDLPTYDELSYLNNGITLIKNGLPLSYLSPLYSLWYYFLSFISQDPVSLLYLNLKFQMIFLPIIFYIFIRACGVSAIISLIGSFLVLISYGNALYTWPRSTHFFIIIILIFMSLAVYFLNNLPISITILASGCLIGSYVRPEYSISFLFLITFLIIICTINFKEKLYRNNILVCLLFLLILSAILYLLIGNPLIDGINTRGFGAFAQNFAFNWVRWHNASINPWTGYEEIIQNNFGNVNNIISAILANPMLFLKHMMFNSVEYIYRLLVLLFVHVNLFIPPYNRLNSFLEALIFVLILGFVIHKIGRQDIVNTSIEHKEIILLFMFLIIISIIIVHITLARDEFILIQYVAIVVVIIMIIDKSVPIIRKELDSNSLILIAVFIIASTPYLAYNYYYTLRSDNIMPVRKQTNLNTVIFIRSLNIKKKVNILEGEGGLNIYLGNNYNRIAEFSKKSEFNEFMKINGINMIVYSKLVYNDVRFKDDSQWLSFLEYYKQYGFEKIIIPNTDRILYVKIDLIKSN